MRNKKSGSMQNQILMVILVGGFLLFLQQTQSQGIATGQLAGPNPISKPDLYPRLVGAIPIYDEVVYHGEGGKSPDMTLAPDGKPVIVHVQADLQIQSVPKSRVMFTKCFNIRCYDSTTIPLTEYGTYTDPAIAFSPLTGFPTIAYFEYISPIKTKLWVRSCSDPDCIGSGTTILLSDKLSSYSRNNPAVAFLPDGQLLVAYGSNPFKPTVTVCKDASCSEIASETALDTKIAIYLNLVLPPDGNPLVVYGTADSPEELRVVKCGNPTCTAENSQPSVIVTTRAWYISTAVPSDQKPVISYKDAKKNGLWMFKCSDSTCSTGNAVLVDGAALSGGHTDIAIDSDGNPIISYDRATLISQYGWALWIADCGDPTCNPTNSGFKNQEFYKAKYADAGGYGDAGHGTAIVQQNGKKLVAHGVTFYDGNVGANLLFTVACSGSLPCETKSNPASLLMTGIKNGGSAPTTGKFQVQFQLPAVQSAKIMNVLYPTSSEWEAFITLPSSQLPPTSVPAQVFADAGNAIAESDETNNIKSWSLWPA